MFETVKIKRLRSMFAAKVRGSHFALFLIGVTSTYT